MQMFGKLVMLVMMGAIVIGLVTTVLATIPSQMINPQSCLKPACDNNPVLCPGVTICAPVGKEVYNHISDGVTIVFIIDYCVRLLTLWACNSRQADLLPMSWYEEHKPSDAPPVYALHWQYFHFIMSLRNLVDLAAILPYFIHAAIPSINVNNNFVRILRLVRVFGLMNRHPVIKMMLSVVVKTIVKSSYALGVLMLLSIIGVVFFAAIIYGVEGGEFKVTSDYPNGIYLRQAWDSGKTSEVESPFNSMGTCIYYVITTMTTVGYGDLTPTTVIGRAVANLIMYCGVVLLALPIGVISSNFSDIYHKDLRISRHGKPVDEEAVDWYECEDASDGEEAVKTRRATVMLMPSHGESHDQMIKTLQDRIELEKQTKTSSNRNKRGGKGKGRLSLKKQKIYVEDFTSVMNEDSMVIDTGHEEGPERNLIAPEYRREKDHRSSGSDSSSDSSRSSYSSDISKSDADELSRSSIHGTNEENTTYTRKMNKYKTTRTRSHHRSKLYHDKTKIITRDTLMPWMLKKKIDEDKYTSLTNQIKSLEHTLADIKATLIHSLK